MYIPGLEEMNSTRIKQRLPHILREKNEAGENVS